jgi:hypothetical protein
MNGRDVLRWAAILSNVALLLWLAGSAVAWAGDWRGGLVVSIPPLLAIVALLRK